MMLSAPTAAMPSSLLQQGGLLCRPAPFRAGSAPAIHRHRLPQLRAAAEDADAEMEKRLEKLRAAKGATGRNNAGVKAAQRTGAAEEMPVEKKKGFDYTGEVEYYEGPPHRGDLALNLALGGTLLWLPLTFAAVGRAAFVRYRFTDKRISVTTTSPFQVEQIDVAYQNVKNVVTIGRFLGLWADILITLRDDTKIDLRSVDRAQELKKYILERRDAMAPPSPLDEPGLVSVVDSSKRGFS